MFRDGCAPKTLESSGRKSAQPFDIPRDAPGLLCAVCRLEVWQLKPKTRLELVTCRFESALERDSPLALRRDCISGKKVSPGDEIRRAHMMIFDFAA